MGATSLTAPNTEVSANLEVLNWLAESPVFKGLGQSALIKFAGGSELRSYGVLEEAVLEGDVPRSLNLVVSGRFIILLPSERLTRFGENAMVSLNCYLAGDSFGEAALVDGSPSPASASIVATEASQVLSISRQTFERAVGADSRIGQVVYRNLFGIQTRRLSALAG